MADWIKHASPKAKITAKDFAQLLNMPISTFWNIGTVKQYLKNRSV